MINHDDLAVSHLSPRTDAEPAATIHVPIQFRPCFTACGRDYVTEGLVVRREGITCPECRALMLPVPRTDAEDGEVRA